MTITLVSNNYHPLTGGGEAERSFKMAEQFIKKNHQVNFISIDDDLPTERKKSLNFYKSLFLPVLFKKIRFPIFYFFSILKTIKSSDVVHLMGHWSMLNVICFFCCIISNKPFYITPAGSIVLFGRSLLFKRLYNFLFGQFILRKAEKIIVISKNEIESIEKFKINSEKIIHIPNGVSELDFDIPSNDNFREKYNIRNQKYIFYIGKINKIKGTDIIIEAFISYAKSNKDYNLVLAGPDDGLKEELLQNIINNNLSDRILFLPVLRGADKVQAYRNCEFVCIPSRKEAMSIVALEAGICKKAVLLTDQCGFNEVGINQLGWVTSPNPNDMIKALQEITKNPDEYLKRGHLFYDYVKTHYDWENLIIKFEKLFSENKI